MENQEIWKDIPNYEGYYQVSNLGRVKSLDRKLFNGKVFYLKKGVWKPRSSRSQSKDWLLFLSVSPFGEYDIFNVGPKITHLKPL